MYMMYTFCRSKLMYTKCIQNVYIQNVYLLWRRGVVLITAAPASFNKVWTQVLRRFKSYSRRVGDSRWWGYLSVVPAGNKAKSLSPVNHITKTIHHHHHHQCIPHFDKLLYTFCIQNLADIVLLILYTKCIQKLVEMWYTFCTHFAYISCIHLVQFLYTKCIHSFSGVFHA